MRLTVPTDWDLPAAFAARLGDAAGRQRAMTADGHLLLVLHQPPTPDGGGRAGRLFWRDPRGAWKSNAFGDESTALRKHLAEFTTATDDLERQFLAARSADDYFAVLRAAAPLHRTTRNLHAALQQARELVPDDRDLINARDQAGEAERAAELLHADARNGLDFTIAHQAEEQARQGHAMALAAHRLNLLAAVFLPVATLAAIFGMNLPHGLERTDGRVLFWSLLAVGLLAGLLLTRAVAAQPTPPGKPAPRRPGRPTSRARSKSLTG
jgi:hypothetical protein